MNKATVQTTIRGVMSASRKLESMEMKWIYQIVFVLLLTGCSFSTEEKRKDFVDSELRIDAPKLRDFYSDNDSINTAINKIIKYLQERNVPIDKMYVAHVDSADAGEWKFELLHYKHYQLKEYYDKNQRRIDSLEAAGVDSYNLDLPPTGNLSGYDREITYSKSKDSIMYDILPQ